MELKDIFNILIEYDLIHDEITIQEQNAGTVDYQKQEIRIARGLSTWDARKTVVHELEHVRRYLQNMPNDDSLVIRETNRIVQDAYKINSPASSLEQRSTDMEITDDILKLFINHIKDNDSIECYSRKCMYNYQHGNRCYLKHVYLRNGICRYYCEGTFTHTRTDIPREIMFGKVKED